MSEAAKNPVLIKRYGNRRLYNTETSSHVNYRDIVELIRAGRDIKVIDSKTKEDITRQILLQVILEEGSDLLPLPFLYQLIRTQEESLHEFFQNYLSASFEAYQKTKQEFERRYRSWLETTASAPQMWENVFKFPGVSKSKRDEDDKS